MAFVRENIDAVVRELIVSAIHSSFIQANPLLYILAGPGIDNLGKLGQPGVPVVFGGSGLSRAQKMTQVGSKERHFRYQTVNPSETANVTYRGATPQSTLFAEDAFGTAVTRWTHFDTPLRISKHALNMAKGGYAIGAIIEDAVGPPINSHLDAIQNQFWNGSLTSTQQDANMWEGYLGLVHTINENNVYGRVDRSVETSMNSVMVDHAGQNATLDMIRTVNVVNNLLAKTPKTHAVKGIDLVITTPKIWMMLAAEAEGKWTINTQGIPHHVFNGFKNPMIRYDQTWIVYDADCPSNTMWGLHTPSWMYELDPNYKFNLDGDWVDKDKTEEAGAFYMWNLFRSIGRLSCTEPWLQVRWRNVTEVTSESISVSSSSSSPSTSSVNSSSSSPSTSSQSVT